MKLIRVIQSKIVKKDNKYQVQSEKGKNLGTYDTKAEAEKRLKQVEMFKHMKKESAILTYANVFKPFVDDLVDNAFDWEITKIEYDEIFIKIYNDTYSDIVVKIDFDLGGFQKERKGLTSPYLATTPEQYYGNEAYYEDFSINKIILIKVGEQKVDIDIPVDSAFGKNLYQAVEEYYRTSEDYF